MSVPPPNVLAYVGEVAVPYIRKGFPPTTAFDKFAIPTLWVDTAAQDAYILVGKDLGTADWIKVGDVSGTVESFTVDSTSGTGVNPVLPSGTYIITVTGGQVASGTTADVIKTDSSEPSKYTIQIQQSGSAAASDTSINGVCHFDSDVFTVTDGFVELTGPLPVANGGTGASTLTGVLTGNGTSAITANAVTEYGVLIGGASNAVASTAVGTATYVLTSNGPGVAPTYQPTAEAADMSYKLSFMFGGM